MTESPCVCEAPVFALTEPVVAFSATRREPSEVFEIAKRDFSPLFALASFNLARKLDEADEISSLLGG